MLEGSSVKPIDRLLEIMARLRNKENGCPWDIEQNFTSIAPHTLEEAYEVVDAIEKKDMQALREELGDLLLQVVFHAQMAQEQKLFTFDDVAQAINDKLVSRHPHVFSDAKVHTAREQEEAWERHKEEERKKGMGGVAGDPLEGVMLSLPALTRALKLQKRAARVGFDWASVDGIFEKLQEEVQELLHVLAHGNTHEAVQEEIGDMLFCCVNLARALKVDPESALRFCNQKFENRLRFMRLELDAQQRNMSDASLQELNDLWDQAKIAEKAPMQKDSQA
jgi:nucleoside triphosphate diphosphatase